MAQETDNKLWSRDPEFNCLTYSFDHGTIWVERRPSYCNRGDWIAKLDVRNCHPHFNVSEQDLWPRYIFGDEKLVKGQIEEWLRRHDINPETGKISKQ